MNNAISVTAGRALWKVKVVGSGPLPIKIPEPETPPPKYRWSGTSKNYIQDFEWIWYLTHGVKGWVGLPSDLQ